MVHLPTIKDHERLSIINQQVMFVTAPPLRTRIMESLELKHLQLTTQVAPLTSIRRVYVMN